MGRLPGRGGRGARLGSGARRAWPVILMAWERWQALPEEDKERYRRRAREYAQRGRNVMEQRRRGGPGGRRY